MRNYNSQGAIKGAPKTEKAEDSKKEDKAIMALDDKKIIHGALKRSQEKGDHKKVAKAICKLFDQIGEEETDDIKKEFLLELYELANGKHFDEVTARCLVDSMENVDGTEGEHWSPEETKALMEKYHFQPKGDKYNEWDWYVILNMMYSDYAEVLGESEELYVALTNAYFNGPDEKEGKAWIRMSPQLFNWDDEED